MSDRKFPNLFVIGAMKSGTTTLHTALGSHPEILMSSYKEPQYFTGTYYRHRLEFDDRPPDPDGRWYFDMFKSAHDDPGIKYAGESSADYTQRPVFEGCAGRIAAFNPAARIIYIVRDPVERCVAHYWHNVQIEYETRPPSEALWEDPRFIAFSDYAMQLQPYLEVFPREQIHVLTLESFRDDQAGALRAIFEWLGVDADYRVPGPIRSNRSPEVIYQVRPGMLWLARALDTRHWRKATRRLPPIFRNGAHKLSWRKIERDAYDFGEIVARLRPILAEKALELSHLLGRDLPEWTTTFAQGPRSAVETAAGRSRG
jgi:Sulfotransferase family